MKQGNKKISSKEKKKLVKIFAMASAITLLLCVGVIFAGVSAYNSTVIEKPDESVQKENLTEEEKKEEEKKEERGELNKTIAVFGVDKDETRTDVMFVVNFNTLTNKIKVINIPRDTRVEWSDRQREKYNELTGYNISVTKLNEMGSYGRIYKNPANIRDFTIDEIENILGVKVDNFVIVNLEAFREIIDAIGGVELDVPQRMYYVDNSQGLYIDLQPGLQTLNGDTAEQFVRFRYGYAEGDTGRISAQQLFLKAFADKVMSPAIMNNLPSIITSLFNYVKTDVQLSEVFGYLELATDFKPENIEFHTVPGEGAYDSYGTSYFYIDNDELDTLIEDVFYDTTVAGEDSQSNADNLEEQTDVNVEDVEEELIDQDVSIEIYNASNIKGLAGTLKDKLEKKGYQVYKIDNYKQNNIVNSTIYTKDEDKAKQFKEYLPSSINIIEDTSIEADIIIVMGQDCSTEE